MRANSPLPAIHDNKHAYHSAEMQPYSQDA